MFKRLLLGILLLVAYSLFPYVVFAASEFSTSYDVLYDVGEDGITTVTEKITLKNLTSEYYANQFKLTIGATQISDIKASDSVGVLNVTSEQKGSSTVINVKFNQQIAGKGKIVPWTITFKSKDFAQKLGKVWEVRAPKISSTSNLENYNLTLAVPASFGELSLISPTPLRQTKSGDKVFLTFNADQLKTSGISANFGLNQLFDFDLSYHLENKNLVPILTNIALPPDTAYQDIIFQRIEPKPLNVTLDDDGNYLAWYKLNRNQKINIKVFGSAKLYSASKVKNPSLDENLKKKYIAGAKYWETNNPQITSKLKEILGTNPPEDSVGKAKLIYQFVVDYLKYDSSRLKDNIERLGATTALANPDSAVCMEFTDLFITLARAAGIPARELDGYAYTTNSALRPLSLNKDILHAWPEYWDDKKGWVMIDPTWGNTTGGVDYFNKLDLNHFVFAVKGLSSSEPIPAGSYKRSFQADSRDVKVSLAEKDFLGHPQIDVIIENPTPILAGFPGQLKVKVVNTGNSFYPSIPFSVKSKQISMFRAEGQELGLVPAFGNAEFTYNIRTKSLFESFEDEIEVEIASQKFTKGVIIRPFILFQTMPMIAGGVVASMILIYFAVLGGLVYRKRYRKVKKK